MVFDTVFLAGTATGATLSVTTIYTLKAFPGLTATARAAELRKLYNMVESQHKNFMEKTLPRLPLPHAKDPNFQGMKKRTFLLEK